MVHTGDAIAFRAEYQEEYEELVKKIQQRAEQKSMEQGMTCRIRLIEPFPATINDAECSDKVKKATESLGLHVTTPKEPFRWSKDFGYYLQKPKGAFWGIGAGENRSGLHTAEYEFNDAIIGTVIDLYAKLMTLPYLHFPYHAETHSQ